MKRLDRMPEGRYFSRLFLYLSSIITITVLAVSYFQYINFVSIEQKKSYSYSEESLSQISYSADSMLANAKMAVTQVLLDTDMPKVFFQSNMDPQELKTITDRLDLIGLMPFLNSVYLYNGKLDLYYTNTNGLQKSAFFSDKSIVRIMKHFKPDMNLKPIARTITRQYSYVDMKEHVYTFIYYEMSGTGSGNAIILNISDAWMKKAIAALDKNRNGSILILDAKGNLVGSVYQNQQLTTRPREKFVDTILHAGTKSGHFIGRVNGFKSLITFTSSDALNWIFVRYTPYRDVVKDVDRQRTLTLQLCVLVMLVGLTLSYVTSRRLNRPVADMLKKLGKHNQVIRENTRKSGQEFLRNLAVSGEAPPLAMLADRFRQYGITLDVARPIAVVVFMIDHFKDFSKKYNAKDHELLRYAIMNIASEVIAVHAPCAAVEIAEDHAAVIVGDGHEQALGKLCREIQQNIGKYLKLSVTAAISLPGSNVSACHSCYLEAMEASRFRIFAGWESVIHARETAHCMQRDYLYPNHKEEQLTDALMLGKTDEAGQICRSILDATKGYSCKDLNLSVFRLFFAINMVVDTLEKASGFSYGINFNERFAQLNELERLEDMKAEFDAMFNLLDQKLDEKKNTKYEKLMEKIERYIGKQYMKTDLGLDRIADYLNISPVYLGRLIKKHLNKSITDCINEVRIGKAAELLADTDQLIIDIAKETGFSSNSYFGRVFKKYRGVTPNEYRERNRRQQ